MLTVCFSLFQMSYNTEEFVHELIELYRSLPCLWQIKLADYSNRMKKREAYEKMIALFKRHNPCEKVDESLVRKKIQGLRTVYKKELNKVEKSRKSDAGTDEVYVSSLWYYDLLGFTRDQELPRATVSSVRPTLEEDPAIHNDPDSPVGDPHQQELVTPTTEDITGSEHSMEDPCEGYSQEPAPSTLLRRQQLSRKKKKAAAQPSPDLCLANQIMANQAKTCMDTFANFAADRLGKLDARQRSHAERVIFETLSKTAEGQLDRSSTVRSVLDRDPDPSEQSWTQMPEPLRSKPVRRIGPPQNLTIHPTTPVSRISTIFFVSNFFSAQARFFD
ncbi:uncharacterized protein [Dendrobates tinctorius]|uniref:uncharacterized protein n=1 Tax=Dendrobates tinctorius TaxID=92724 RepID=UPI003CC9623F